MSTISEGHGPFVGSMSRVVLHWVLEQIYAGVVAAGFDDLTRAEVGLFRFPTSEGLRPSELAQRLRVTKQSVNDLLRGTERHEYLVLVPDPVDRRARVIHLTARGRQFEKVLYRCAGAAEASIANLLGPDSFAQFRTALECVVEAINDGALTTSE